MDFCLGRVTSLKAQPLKKNRTGIQISSSGFTTHLHTFIIMLKHNIVPTAYIHKVGHYSKNVNPSA